MTNTASGSATLTLPSDREIVITRAFAAPRRLVFEACTKPEHVRRWYGLRSLTMTVCEIDLRPGGSWRYVLQAQDGSEYAFSGVYREITPHERLVYTEGYEAMPGADYLVTTTFDEQDGKTTLTSHLLYKSKEHRDGHIASGMESGMNESLDRLEQLAGVMDREIVMSRVINAPRGLVFDAWTNRDHVDKWWGPPGCRTVTSEMEVRPGGMWRFVMHAPNGVDYGNRIVYREVVRPERLVFDHGDDVADDPNAFHATVTFDDADGKTRVTMRSLFKTAKQRDETVAFGAIEIGNQTLDNLEAFVSKMVAQATHQKGD